MSGIVNNVLRKAMKCIRGNVKKNENPVRWGIIGLGYMAECFSSAIDGNPNGVVVAAASRSIDKAKEFAGKHGNCKAYGCYQSMINDNNVSVDIVYIATPTKYHYENIKICLQAGKNVLCEKPITTNVHELEELQQLAKLNGCFLMEGMWMKCLPTYQKALEWIKEDRIGTVELIKADFYKREKIDLSRTVFNNKEGGGVLRDYGVYAIAFPTGFVNGMPDVLNGYSRKSSYDIDSDWMIHMRFGDTQVFLNLSSDFQGTSKAAVIGNKGTIEWNAQFNRTGIITLYDTLGRQMEMYKESYAFEGFEFEIDEVHRCVKMGLRESMIVPLDSSFVTIRIIDKLLRDGTR